jgi:hypothetical protein
MFKFYDLRGGFKNAVRHGRGFGKFANSNAYDGKIRWKVNGWILDKTKRLMCC